MGIYPNFDEFLRMAGVSCGIVGLPNVGKSTLFNALTAGGAESSNYPFCTINPNRGVVDLRDDRLDRLAILSKSEKIVYATVEFDDIAGLVKGASKGEGLGNKFLAHIRETDAIIHVVRCFESTEIAHVSGEIDPIKDIEVVNLELILADLQTIEKLIAKTEKQAKGNKEMDALLAGFKKIQQSLDHNQPVRSVDLSDEEKILLKPYPFLTSKKVLYACNVSEDDLPEMENLLVQRVREFAEKEGNQVLPICATLEAEIAELPAQEQASYLESLGLKESGLQRLVRASFELLHLINFITTGEMETKAWTIKKGTSARDAAGKIHTDIQKGFIRAEVITFEDLMAYGGRAGCREHGKIRSEGKDYCVHDGDVILFLHN